MAINLDVLKKSLDEFIKKDTVSITELKEILAPVSKFVDSPVFIQNIGSIIDIIVTDRNGDKKFDILDLRLLGTDVMAISSLVSSILLVILSIPNLKIKYDEGATEELIFKILAYVFLILIPIKTDKKLTIDEKTFIVNLTLIIYDTIKSSGVVEDLFVKIKRQIKTKKCYICFSVQPDPLAKNLPMSKLNLTANMNNLRDKAAIENQIKLLQQQLADK